jgi:redox-sensitive bicupin YhaK (pirin superfamily)
MSAGSGLMHSEFNHSKTEEINLLQIWVFPKEKNIEPRYEQRVFSEKEKEGNFKTIVAPVKSDDVMWINQDSYFSIGKFKAGVSVDYSIQHKGNGAYVFMIEGNSVVEKQDLSNRDAIGIWETPGFLINVKTDSEILVIEVPMN